MQLSRLFVCFCLTFVVKKTLLSKLLPRWHTRCKESELHVGILSLSLHDGKRLICLAKVEGRSISFRSIAFLSPFLLISSKHVKPHYYFKMILFRIQPKQTNKKQQNNNNKNKTKNKSLQNQKEKSLFNVMSPDKCSPFFPFFPLFMQYLLGETC